MYFFSPFELNFFSFRIYQFNGFEFFKGTIDSGIDRNHSQSSQSSSVVDNSAKISPIDRPFGNIQKENSNPNNDDDLLLYPIDTTPKKMQSASTPRKNSQQTHIDRAFAAQLECNKLLKEIVGQNKQVIETNKTIINVLNEVVITLRENKRI